MIIDIGTDEGYRIFKVMEDLALLNEKELNDAFAEVLEELRRADELDLPVTREAALERLDVLAKEAERRGKASRRHR